MEGIMVSAQSILVMAAVLIAQYFLAKRPQTWLAFILPVVFALADKLAQCFTN